MRAKERGLRSGVGRRVPTRPGAETGYGYSTTLLGFVFASVGGPKSFTT